MWSDDGDLFAAVKSAEESLMSSSTRNDAEALNSLLAADFAEIGRSGRVWTTQEMMLALTEEDPRAQPDTSEWRFNEITAGISLVTYRVHTPERDSRHSSLWDTTGDRPVLRFHQGTVIPSS